MSDFPLISIDIQLNENETSKLEIFDENEDIENKVYEFCKKHNLSDNIKYLLEKQVFEELEKKINEIQLSINSNSMNEENKHLETINSLSNIEKDSDEEIDPKQYLLTDNPPLIPTLNGKNNDYKFSCNNSNKNFYNQSFYHLKGGEKLYFQFKEKLSKKEEIRDKILQEKIEEENKNLSFHPNISQYSKFLTRNYSEEPIENRLINYGIKQKEKNLRLKTQKDLKKNINETFMPKIPESSKILGNIKRKNRIENLNYEFLNNINPDYIQLSRNKSTDCINNNNNNRIASFNNNNNIINYKKSINKNSSARTTVNTNYSSKINSQRVTEGNYNNNNINYNNNYNNSIEGKKSFIFQKKIPVPILNPETNIHDYLYLESKIIQEKKEKDFEENIKKNCSFTPFIPQKVRDLVKNRKETKTEFLNRMTRKNKFEINEIIIKKNDINKKFKSKDRKKKLNKSNENINKRDKSENKSEKIKNEMQKKKKNLYLENTQKIILKMKIEKFQEIFNLLDGDSDGLISNNKILLSNINAELLLALSPIFEELQNNSNITMNFKQFCLKADKLLTPIIFPKN